MSKLQVRSLLIAVWRGFLQWITLRRALVLVGIVFIIIIVLRRPFFSLLAALALVGVAYILSRLGGVFIGKPAEDGADVAGFLAGGITRVMRVTAPALKPAEPKPPPITRGELWLGNKQGGDVEAVTEFDAKSRQGKVWLGPASDGRPDAVCSYDAETDFGQIWAGTRVGGRPDAVFEIDEKKNTGRIWQGESRHGPAHIVFQLEQTPRRVYMGDKKRGEAMAVFHGDTVGMAAAIALTSGII